MAPWFFRYTDDIQATLWLRRWADKGGGFLARFPRSPRTNDRRRNPARPPWRTGLRWSTWPAIDLLAFPTFTRRTSAEPHTW